jgi:Predicted nucleotide-binding protein containing TIR-like domain/Domain of unknown function (DUF6430)
MKHRIFVGSSVEQLKLARAVRTNLSAYGHVVTVWDQGIFSIGKVTLDALVSSLDRFDAAVFVFAPSDLLRIRGREFEAVRDNVLFELGLFTGRIGRDRTFWLVPRGHGDFRTASDLSGVLPAEYTVPDDDDWMSAFGVACDQIHEALIESARERGRRCPPLTSDIVGLCVPHLNRVMEHMTGALAASPIDISAACVETLPADGSLRAHVNPRQQLTVTYGGIEQCASDSRDAVVVLPANEFFDDACIVDNRSALGTFVNHHFGDDLDAFKQLVASERRALRPLLVEREAGQYQESYGVGTSIYLSLPLRRSVHVILTAVTRKRAGEGIKAEPAYIFACMQSINRIVNDNKFTEVHVPLLGAGHGDMSPEVALFCLIAALATMPDIRRANIVLRPYSAASGGVAPSVVKKMLAYVCGAAYS